MDPVKDPVVTIDDDNVQWVKQFPFLTKKMIYNKSKSCAWQLCKCAQEYKNDHQFLMRATSDFIVRVPVIFPIISHNEQTKTLKFQISPQVAEFLQKIEYYKVSNIVNYLNRSAVLCHQTRKKDKKFIEMFIDCMSCHCCSDDNDNYIKTSKGKLQSYMDRQSRECIILTVMNYNDENLNLSDTIDIIMCINLENHNGHVQWKIEWILKN